MVFRMYLYRQCSFLSQSLSHNSLDSFTPGSRPRLPGSGRPPSGTSGTRPSSVLVLGSRRSREGTSTGLRRRRTGRTGRGERHARRTHVRVFSPGLLRNRTRRGKQGEERGDGGRDGTGTGQRPTAGPTPFRVTRRGTPCATRAVVPDRGGASGASP